MLELSPPGVGLGDIDAQPPPHPEDRKHKATRAMTINSE
jgi:hypothetical protein